MSAMNRKKVINSKFYENVSSAISVPDLQSKDLILLVEEGEKDRLVSPRARTSSFTSRTSQLMQHSSIQSIASLILFAVTSLGMNFFNKYMLSEFKTDEYQLSFVFLQMICSVASLYALKYAKIIEMQALSFDRFKVKLIQLLGICYLSNTVFSLYALSVLTVSTYSVSKRLTPVMVIAIELFIASKNKSVNHLVHQHSWNTIISVLFIVIGASLTVFKALDVTFQGVIYALLACTTKAFYSLLMQMLSRNEETKDLSATDIVLTNSILSIPLIGITSLFVTENRYKMVSDILSSTSNPRYLICLIIFMSQGLINQIVLYLCTRYNTAITTTVIGQFKIPIIILIDIVVNKKFPKSVVNVFGLITVNLAGLYYSFSMYHSGKQKGKNRPTGRKTIEV